MKRKPKLTDEATIKGIKLAMAYKDGTRCCKACDFFGERETFLALSDARPARCERNAMWFPVSELGSCDEFSPRRSVSIPRPAYEPGFVDSR